MTRENVLDAATAFFFFALAALSGWFSFGDVWAWLSCVIAPKISCEPVWAQTMSGRMCGAGLAILMFGLGLRVVWNMHGKE